MKNKLNPPSRLSFKQYNKKVSIGFENSDIDMEEFFESCKLLALAVGYHQKTVSEYFEE